MSKKTIGILAGIVLLFGGLAAVLAGMYNGLVRKSVAVDSSWAQVENVLQRRSDLIPNLVATVKGYAQHEKAILEKLAEARSRYAGAGSVQDKMRAANDLGGALARLLVVVENYPNLKADGTFLRMMDELSGTENRISVERMRYNAAVEEYTFATQRFPSNLVAKAMGFKEKPFFEAEETAKEVPTVDFKP